MDKLILVLDHLEKDIERFSKWLRREGCETLPCTSGAALENALQSDRQFIAAILCREFKGAATWAALLKRLKTLRPAMPVIIVDAQLSLELALNAKAQGADDCFSKSTSEDAFRARLRPFIHGDPEVEAAVERMKQKLKMIGDSPRWMETLREVARIVRRPDDSVLIAGETGTGKELIAQAIHDFTPSRHQSRYIPISLVERNKETLAGELFGHEKGAFTGADRQRIGWLEEVGEGTLFFDEIGEIPSDLQSALLRVVQEREFRRLGGPLIKFKGRFVFATNRYLPDTVAEGNFRGDLFYRIAQVKISLPPLREHREDIPLLLNHLLAEHQQPQNKGSASRPAKSFDADVYREVLKLPLRGNVRDIQRIVREGLAKSRGDIIGLFDLPEDLLYGAAQPPTTTLPQPILDELSRELPADWEALKYEAAERIFNRVYLKLLLDRHPNKSEAAEAADFARKTLYNLLRKYGLAGAAEDEADEASDS